MFPCVEFAVIVYCNFPSELLTNSAGLLSALIAFLLPAVMHSGPVQTQRLTNRPDSALVTPQDVPSLPDLFGSYLRSTCSVSRSVAVGPLAVGQTIAERDYAHTMRLNAFVVSLWDESKDCWTEGPERGSIQGGE